MGTYGLLDVTYPDGTVVSYSHTARNQLKQLIADGPPPLATYAYNLNGQRTTKTLENGTVAAYLYDNANRLTQVAHSNSSGKRKGSVLASCHFRA